MGLELSANIIVAFMLIVTVSRIVTEVTLTPQKGWKKKLYRVLDICAFNVWKAKQK